jgi:RNA-binding protein 26
MSSSRSRRVARPNRCVLVSFGHRSLLTTVLQGLAKGTNIPTVGQVQLAWHTAPAPTKPAAIEAASSSSAMDTTEHGPADGGAAPDAMLEDEELPTTGWGADGADDADVAVGMF